VECRKDFVRCLGGRGEHELHRPKHTDSDLLEFTTFREDSGLANISKHHVGPANGSGWTIEGLRDGFLDRVLFEADAKIASNDFDAVFRFGRCQSPMKLDYYRQLPRVLNLHQLVTVRLGFGGL